MCISATVYTLQTNRQRASHLPTHLAGHLAKLDDAEFGGEIVPVSAVLLLWLLLLLPGRGGVQLELHLLTAPPPAVYCPLASCALLWEQLPGAGGRWWLQWLQCPAVNTHRWSRPLPSGHNTGPVLYCAVLCCTVLYRADTVMSYPAIIMISGAGLPEYEGNILHAKYILHKIIYSAVN